MKTVTVKNSEGYEAHIYSGQHEIIADEPQSSGGTDAGPTPYDLLLGALGSCMAITLKMYAEKKQIDLLSITINLSQDRIHAKDCEECESEEGHISKIEVELSLGGNLSDDQKKRLLEIAQLCPVHKTLTSEIIIKTELV